jgi:hypothetical protein
MCSRNLCHTWKRTSGQTRVIGRDRKPTGDARAKPSGLSVTYVPDDRNFCRYNQVFGQYLIAKASVEYLVRHRLADDATYREVLRHKTQKAPCCLLAQPSYRPVLSVVGYQLIGSLSMPIRPWRRRCSRPSEGLGQPVGTAFYSDGGYLGTK